MIRMLFKWLWNTGDMEAIEVKSFYGLSSPNAEAAQRRERAATKAKKQLGDKYLLAKPVSKVVL